MAGGRRREAALLRAGLAALLCVLHVQAACQDASVTQELLKEGFHRDLLVKVELGVVGKDAGGCAVAARTSLPPGIYVDPYEVASLQRHNLTKVVLIPDVVDVEAPEYLATDHLVLLYMEPDPQCSRCFRAALPVHGRYHRPAEETEEALVVLKSPEVLVCCCDNRLSTECWKPAAVEGPCSGKTDGPCQWYSIMHKPIPAGVSAALVRKHFGAFCITEKPSSFFGESWLLSDPRNAHSESFSLPCCITYISSMVYEELILQVPVGLRQHSLLVCVVTLLATVLCSSLILAAVCKYGHFSLVTCSE